MRRRVCRQEEIPTGLGTVLLTGLAALLLTGGKAVLASVHGTGWSGTAALGGAVLFVAMASRNVLKAMLSPQRPRREAPAATIRLRAGRVDGSLVIESDDRGGASPVAVYLVLTQHRCPDEMRERAVRLARELGLPLIFVTRVPASWIPLRTRQRLTEVARLLYRAAKELPEARVEFHCVPAQYQVLDVLQKLPCESVILLPKRHRMSRVLRKSGFVVCEGLAVP